ncbi:MAG TPA: imidazoleglycerol-phosphate dehydratase HisB [Candidatus Latescibacteria bacterium]|nr:imidazoleglycerol-phosphate dehydratase HisB [Candidatus Latescibacterota bacterium]
MTEKRRGQIERATTETRIELKLTLDGSGQYQVKTGIGFFDHLLSLFARHGFFDLEVSCGCDLGVDTHHCVEDVGICLGGAIDQALGDRTGITRYGTSYVPMDQSLARVVIDLSGRSYLMFNADLKMERVGEFETELAQEFFRAVVDNSKMNLHIDLLRGTNGHHNLEAIFKAFGRALDQASSLDKRLKGVLSTKGML